MTRLGLIRHGITDWNNERRAQGQSDVPLNTSGRAQATALANRLRGEDWDLIYASDLSRAKETAEIVAKALELTVTLDPRLREMNCGEMEGTTEEERIEKWGIGWRDLDLGIEDEESIRKRGLSLITEVSEKHADKRILVVSHGALLGLTLKQLIPHVDTEEHLHNTSITRLVHTGGRWECELYNCAKHLTVQMNH